MKLFLALLLLIPSLSRPYAAGTAALYQGSLVDSTGQAGNLVNVGSTPLVSTPVSCDLVSQFWGVFGNGQLVKLPAALVTAMQSYTSWGIEVCVNPTSLASGFSVIFSDASSNYVQVDATGRTRWSTSGGILPYNSNNITAGVSQKFYTRYTASGTIKRLYVNNVQVDPNATQAASLSGLAQMIFGRYSVGSNTEQLNGYITSIRVINGDYAPPFIDSGPDDRRRRMN